MDKKSCYPQTHNTETMYKKSCHSQSRLHRNHGQDNLPPTKGKTRETMDKKSCYSQHTTQKLGTGKAAIYNNITQKPWTRRAATQKGQKHTNRTHIAYRNSPLCCSCTKPWRPRRPKRTPRWPRTPKIAARWPESQEGPHMVQNGPRWPPDGPHANGPRLRMSALRLARV